MSHVVRFAAALVLALTAAGAFAAGPTIDVTTVADDGPGSYRDAIRKVNDLWNRGCTYADPCTIRFAIPGPVPPDGWFTIAPKSPLPSYQNTWHFTIDGAYQTALTGDTNQLGPEIELDGTDAGFSSGIRMSRVGDVKVIGLAVNRFAAHGISLLDSSDVTLGAGVYGRESTDALFIGVDPTGRIARANGMDGVAALRTSNVQLHRSVIAGNRSNGVFVRRGNGFEARNNFIGTGRDRRPIPNGANGFHFDIQAAQVLWNVIAHNAHFGVVAEDPGGRITIRENEIYDNGLLNIGVGHDGVDEADPLDMDLGPNGRMNAPVLTRALSTGSTESWRFSFNGSIRSKPDAEITIEVFAAPTLNPLGQANARTVIARGTVRTDANGKADFGLPWQSDESYLSEVWNTTRFTTFATGWMTATATTSEGTSELSAPVPIRPQGSIEVTAVDDAGPGSLRDAIETANAGGCSAELPCWITFRIPANDLRDGVAIFTPRSALPAIITDHVHLDGGSQTWSVGDTNPAGPEIEIRGSVAEGTGLTIGTAERKVAHADVNDLAVTGFGGIGIDVHTSEETAMGRGHAVRLDGLYVGIEATGRIRGNFGDGIRIRGARAPGLYSESVLSNSSIGGNGGNGLRIAADGTWVRGLRVGVTPAGKAASNGGAGILIDGADGVGIEGSTVAHNLGPGVSTTRESKKVYVSTAAVWNGGLGIDRNADGAGGGAADGVTPAPLLASAVYDAARGVTVIEGELGSGRPALDPPSGPTGDEMHLQFFVSSAREADGSVEGERPARFQPTWTPLTFTNGRFRTEIKDDLRGWLLTATTSLAYCYWEFGCHGIDTSEFSNAIEVK